MDIKQIEFYILEKLYTVPEISLGYFDSRVSLLMVLGFFLSPLKTELWMLGGQPLVLNMKNNVFKKIIIQN